MTVFSEFKPAPSRRLFFVSAAVALAFGATISLSNPAHANAAAEAWVKRVGNSVLSSVSGSGSRSAKAARFGRILRSNADMRRIGIFALGPYARKISGGQRSEYFKLLPKFVISTYFNRLLEWGKGGGVVEVTGSQQRGKETIVNSNIKFGNGRVLPVKWRLITAGGIKLFDLNVSGVWLTIEQRSNFVSRIKRNGGDVSSLIAFMRSN